MRKSTWLPVALVGVIALALSVGVSFGLASAMKGDGAPPRMAATDSGVRIATGTEPAALPAMSEAAKQAKPKKVVRKKKKSTSKKKKTSKKGSSATVVSGGVPAQTSTNPSTQSTAPAQQQQSAPVQRNVAPAQGSGSSSSSSSSKSKGNDDGGEFILGSG